MFLVMERTSLERAFESYWPPPKAKSKTIPLTAIPEAADIQGIGVPNGWGQWQADPAQPGAHVRISICGDYVQFRNMTKEIRRVGAVRGSRTFALTLNPGQIRDVHCAEPGGWRVMT
jgi:hypothetical protein